MIKHSTIKHSMITLLVVGGACADAGEDPVGEASQAAISFNGRCLNGMNFNGTSLTGASGAGISVNATTLTASSTSGPPLAGSNVVGSTWTATLSDGSTV